MLKGGLLINLIIPPDHYVDVSDMFQFHYKAMKFRKNSDNDLTLMRLVN